ncbi:MAG: Gfo/Idh/MocA family oxidoreductase [Planctomycetales bacterium]|nr:Gfo/Idh/MocA family oxidoreductase [Planctomycetales bacterium]
MHRRHFLASTSAVAFSSLAWRSVRAVGPNEKLQTAHIGVGGMGSADLNSISSHPDVEVAALCDVDANRLKAAQERFPNAKTFQDYQDMLTTMADQIDAVSVSTPDHTHAPASLAAMQQGKPVYCQKPLTHTIEQTKTLRKIAQEKNLVTQMGIQVHASQPYRRATRMIQDGAIGKVSEVHAWSNKNWGYDGGPFAGSDPVPDYLNWELWLGTAEERPFKNGIYHPGNWRKLVDFGTGTLGDMGVHIFDTPFRALELTVPIWAHNICRPPTGIGHPEKNEVTYEFPATQYTTDRLIWKWYDGASAPPNLQLASLPEGFNLPGQGSLFVGEDGIMLLPHVGEPVLFPEEKFKDYARPDMEPLDHYHQWVDACFGRTKTSAHFGYAGALTEALLYGVVAGQGMRIQSNS